MENPRCHHYMLAHVALKQIALENPLFYLGVLASESRSEFLEDLFESVDQHCRTQAARADFSAADLRFHGLRVGQFPCAIVEFPAPRETTEVFFTALVVLADPSQPLPEREALTARYFTLERGFSLDGMPRTVLGEWTMDGAHVNYGDGPEPALATFAAALEGHVSQK
jgi:hypothetical protein